MEQTRGPIVLPKDAGAVITLPIATYSAYYHGDEAFNKNYGGSYDFHKAQKTSRKTASPEAQDQLHFNKRLTYPYPANLPSTYPVNEGNQDREFCDVRLLSLRAWPHNTPQAGYMAQVGFFQNGPRMWNAFDDRVECFSCGLVLDNWVPQHDPLLRHLQENSHCDWARRVAEFYEGKDHLRERDVLDVSVMPSGAFWASVDPRWTLPRPNPRCRGCNKTFGTFLGLRTHQALRGSRCRRPDTSPSSYEVWSAPLTDRGKDPTPLGGENHKGS